jgi:hypothetical protein
MVASIRIITKKIFSLSLILNSLITLAAIAQIMFNFYHSFPYWQPYSPYLINGSVFFLVIIAALLNIYPSASIGRTLHTGRLLFHHYVYGFLVLLFSSFFVIAFTSVSMLSLFLVYNESVMVNAGKFLFLGGLTLLLDDLPDVSKRIDSTLTSLKFKAYQGRKIIHIFQLVTGIVSFYVSIAVGFWAIQHPEIAFAAFFTSGTFLITSLTSLVFVKRKAWLKVTPTQ